MKIVSPIVVKEESEAYHVEFARGIYNPIQYSYFFSLVANVEGSDKNTCAANHMLALDASIKLLQDELMFLRARASEDMHYQLPNPTTIRSI